MTLEIRAARPEDTPAIAAVHVASSRYTYREILPGDWLDALSTDAKNRPVNAGRFAVFAESSARGPAQGA